LALQFLLYWPWDNQFSPLVCHQGVCISKFSGFQSSCQSKQQQQKTSLVTTPFKNKPTLPFTVKSIVAFYVIAIIFTDVLGDKGDNSVGAK